MPDRRISQPPHAEEPIDAIWFDPFLLGSSAESPLLLTFGAQDHTPADEAEWPGWPTDARARETLGNRLAVLLPKLDVAPLDHLLSLVIAILEHIARSQILLTRQALNTALSDVVCLPPQHCYRQAKQTALILAEPALHCCLTLSDQDLETLISRHPACIALTGAPTTSPYIDGARPCDWSANSATDYNHRASNVTLDNQGAIIAASFVVDHHPRESENRGAPLQALALRLFRLVDQAILQNMQAAGGAFESGDVADILEVVRRRVLWKQTARPDETPLERARRLHQECRLDEQALDNALSWNEMEFVKSGLALRSRIRTQIIDSILKSKNPRVVTALAWRAGLTMRAARQLQLRGAGIPPRQVLNAHNGTGYPLSPVEMARQLELYEAPIAD
ncbi:DUF2336 domain-containing protein [Azospirillaceae bacterium]